MKRLRNPIKGDKYIYTFMNTMILKQLLINSIYRINFKIHKTLNFGLRILLGIKSDEKWQIQ